jgi:phosphoribosyl-AMP cyclohydrolase
MVKIYEVAYSEVSVHHKKFTAESQDDAIDAARKDLEKHYWDVSKAKSWEHGSGEGGQFEVIDILDKEDKNAVRD